MKQAFGITLIAFFLTAQLCEALPTNGLLPAMPMNCSGLDYCMEKHEMYPQELVDLLLEKLDFTVETNQEPLESNRRDKREGKEDTKEICEISAHYGKIYEIVDANYDVRVVVQSPKFYQSFRIEKCLNPGALASDRFVPPQLESSSLYCVETKMEYNFLVLARDGKGIEFVKNKSGIPVCCSCRMTLD